jgi:hypothetical protein
MGEAACDAVARTVGDLVLADAKGSGGWIVSRIDHGRSRLLVRERTGFGSRRARVLLAPERRGWSRGHVPGIPPRVSDPSDCAISAKRAEAQSP